MNPFAPTPRVRMSLLVNNAIRTVDNAARYKQELYIAETDPNEIVTCIL